MFLRKIALFLLLLFLNGCGGVSTTEETLYSLTLNNSDQSEYEVLDNLSKDQIIDLPVLEAEDLIFVGWSDGDNLYYLDYTVWENRTLTAVFEDPEEVFVIESSPDDKYHQITSYNGDAKYLRIPVYINDLLITTIASEAFLDSELIEVEIPKSISAINPHAFIGSESLEKISFYGEYFGEKDLTITNEQYDTLMTEFSDVCTIEENSETSWIFSEGCPIKSVNSQTDPVIIDEVEYFLYNVTVDLRYFELDNTSLFLSDYAFSGLTNLKTVEFPERYAFFNPMVFSYNPSLETVTFDDNPYFQVIDGVVYDDSGTRLEYYPQGLSGDSFTIPDFVEVIDHGAFAYNRNIKTLIIPETLKTISGGSLYFMYSLEEIIVDSNPDFYSIYGVLYFKNHTLILYPMSKTDTEFTLHGEVITIGPYAFAGQRYLEKINFPDSLEIIAYSAFRDVEKLTILDIPASVTFIDRDLTINSSIESIIIRRSFEADGSITYTTLFPYTNMPTIYLPDDSIDIYLESNQWLMLQGYVKSYSEFNK